MLATLTPKLQPLRKEVVMKTNIAGRTQLTISTNGRYLEWRRGLPFFYLADTAWALFKRLTREEVEHYLSNRAQKGFTVIQAYVLRGLEVSNLYGDLPLIDRDPTQLNDAFFRNVDYIVRRANELGLVMGLVAVMGEHVRRKHGSERFGQRNEQIFTVENARSFGELLGSRYKNDGVIWILGGDTSPQEADVAIWCAMAAGLKAGSRNAHLVTYHANGGHSSSEQFHNFDWLDFNTVQSLHKSQNPNYEYVARDYALLPVKPTLDMEARYEGHPDGRLLDLKKVFAGEQEPSIRVDASDARQAAYWALFAGAAGHGYGHNDVWQFNDSREFDSTRDYSFPFTPPSGKWVDSIDSEGAFSMSHLKRLLELRPWYDAVPDEALIVVGQGVGEDRVLALRARDNSFVIVYLSLGNSATIRIGVMPGASIRASWYDPRNGRFSGTKELEKTEEHVFVPPSSGHGHDWVLVLDDPARGYAVS